MRAFDTVDIETPASFATSLIVIFALLIPDGVIWYAYISEPIGILADKNITIPMIIIMYFSVVMAFIVLFALYRLLDNITKDKVFIPQYTTCLRVISSACMLAGFSMGGRETIFITLQRPELFGYVCAISAAPGIVPAKDKFMVHEGQISEDEMKFADGATEPNVFIICCGTRDSVVGQFPKQYHELLETNGANHIWYEINGADHDNNAIKSGLFNLFKQIAFDKSK